jgi:predicted MFS family arabinose efflux permease
VVYELVGLSGAYGVTTLLSVMNFALAWPIVHRQVTRRLSVGAVARDLLDGVRSALTIPEITAALAVTVAMNAFCFCYSALVAPLALRLFGVTDALVGFLGAAEPAGALLAGLFLTRSTPRMAPRLMMVSGSVLFAVSLMAMPFAGGFWLACLLMVVGGTGTAAFSNMQTMIVLTAAPAPMRSRLLGLVTVGIGTGPIGQLMIGALADGLGLVAAVEIMAAVGLAGILGIGLVWRLADRAGTRRGA